MAELLAAVDAVDSLKNFKHLPERALNTQTTAIALDSRSAFRLCTTRKEPEAAKNKFLFASIRKKFYTSSMTIPRCTSAQTNLAEVQTKDNQDVSKLLNSSLASSHHNFPPMSYVATANTPRPATAQPDRMERSKKTYGKTLIVEHPV